MNPHLGVPRPGWPPLPLRQPQTLRIIRLIRLQPRREGSVYDERQQQILEIALKGPLRPLLGPSCSLSVPFPSDT